MNEQEVSWRHTFSVWWLLVWRALLGAFFIGGGGGFVIGFVSGLAGMPPGFLATAAGIWGGLVGITWGVVVVRMALRKKYRAFRLAIVPSG